MYENLSISQRTTSKRIGVSQKTIQRILPGWNLRPYKIQLTHPLNEDYKQKRFVFAQNMNQLINDDGINVNQIFFCDKANFYLLTMDSLTNKITGFRHTKSSHSRNQGIKTSKSHRLLCSVR